MKPQDIWMKAFLYAMDDRRYENADKCTSFADGVCDHFENRFGSDEGPDMKKEEVTKSPTFTV